MPFSIRMHGGFRVPWFPSDDDGRPARWSTLFDSTLACCTQSRKPEAALHRDVPLLESSSSAEATVAVDGGSMHTAEK